MNNHQFSDRISPRMLQSEPLRRCTLDDCHGACCVFGVWVDLREVADIMANARLIIPHMPSGSRNQSEWFAPIEDNDQHSPTGKVIHTAIENRPEHYGGTACIFWREDAKCALQVAAVKNSLHPWRFKPYYCILHPLDQDETGRITLDAAEELVNEPGSCLRSSDSSIPLIYTFEEELRYLLGDKAYGAIRTSVESLSRTDEDEK
jgi:hypothetical protein